MDERILRLKELQEIGLALRALELERQQGPERLASLEEAFNETSAVVGAAKHRHDALREEAALMEIEQRDFQDKLAKFQAQLMEVKNSREYSAVLKEIDAAKLEISRRDDGILERMQEMEALQKDLPEVEAKLVAEAEAYHKEREAILSAMETLDKRREEMERARQRIESMLPRDIVGSFYRVAEARQGLAMARIVESVCSACNVRLRPQVFNEVKRGDTLVACDSCRRFLYFDPEEANEAPPQEGSGPA